MKKPEPKPKPGRKGGGVGFEHAGESAKVTDRRHDKRTDDDEHEEEPADLHNGLRDHLDQRARGPEALEEVEALPPVPFGGRGWGSENALQGIGLCPSPSSCLLRTHAPEHDGDDGEAVGDHPGRGEDDRVGVEREAQGVDPGPALQTKCVV